MVAVARDANGLDQPLLAEKPQVARARIGWPVMMVAQVTTGDDPKGPDGRERARLRAAECVLPVAIPNDLPLQSARQVDVTREHVTRVYVALACITVALRPPGVVVPIAGVLIGVRASGIASWTAADCPGIVDPVGRSDLRLASVVNALIVGGMAASRMLIAEALVIARVMIARVEIEHRGLRRSSQPFDSKAERLRCVTQV
jgi:hypothetical protein